MQTPSFAGGVVGAIDRFIQGVCRNHRSHWTKDLFLRDAHVRAHIGEDRGLDEEAVPVFAFGQMMSTASEGGAVFVLSDVNVAHDLVHGFRHWPLLLGTQRPPIKLW